MTPKNKPDKKKEPKTQILIVDDHPVVREGLAAILNHEPDLQVCGEAEEAHQAVKRIAELKPDIVIADISLKNSDGLDLTRRIKTKYPHLSVIVLSVHDESLYAERALLAGAQAYLMKDAVSDNIIRAIRTVLNGEIYVSPAISRRFLRQIAGDRAGAAQSPVETLSDREFEIFRLIGEGYKASQIAEQLHRSIKTIETHRARIKEKLGFDTAAELLRHAIQWNKSQNGK